MASRTLALGGCCSARFWLSAFCVALMPTSVGYQEIAAFFSSPPAMAKAPHPHLIPSPFGTIEPATYSYGRQPIGTAMPQPPVFELASFDPNSAIDAPTWTVDRPLQARAALVDYPKVNRRLKGDRWPVAKKIGPAASEPKSLPPLQPVGATPVEPSRAAPPAPAAGSHLKAVEAPSAAPPAAPAAPVATTAPINEASDLPAAIPASGELSDSPGLFADTALAFADDAPDERGPNIYFGAVVTGSIGGLERWAPGAAPILAAPPSEASLELAALQQPDAAELNAEDMVRQSPAQRLGLAGKERAKAEKCLADAVYFEARGEPLRGQEAVAQVVMNRVFSGYYPNNVCGVVFQNASHYLGCQFTFACEHKDLSRIDEPDMWGQAKRIAKDTLDGKIWLADIGHATHYHAYWVHPSWVHEMTRLYKLGVHTFYRPRAWGNGDYEPVWGKPAADDDKPQAANNPRNAIM
jgi:spore germination cell wall hydrolase CwlJ-like protein